MDSYEKKYKEALCWMQSVYPTMTGTTKEDAEHYFPELEEEGERIRKELLDFAIKANNGVTSFLANDYDFSKWIAWLEKQGEKKSDDEVMKIRRKAYSDGYMHGQDNIAIALGKESVEALEHFVRSIGESGYASPYDNRTKLVYRLLEQLKQIVK